MFTRNATKALPVGVFLVLMVISPVFANGLKHARFTVSAQSAAVGGKVTVTGSHLPKKRKVTIKALGKKIARATTSSKGRFKKIVTIPSTTSKAVKLRIYIGKKRYTKTIAILEKTIGSTPITDPSSALSPNTTGDNSTSGESSPTLVAAGDIACSPSDTSNSCQQAATAEVVRTIHPTAIALLGDNQYENGTLSDFQNSFALSWGTLTEPMYPVPGNHEYNTANAEGYYSYFGSRAGDPTKGYYSYDIGNWHVIALNSNSDCIAISCSAGSTQEQWLRADLAAHSASSCTIAYWHHPRFSSGNHGSNLNYVPFWQALDEYNVDIVLNGHDHDYERFAPQDADGTATDSGPREFVVGTGGKNETRPSSPQPNSQAFQNTEFGVLKLTLNATSYAWQFVPTAGGTYTDSGTSNCH